MGERVEINIDMNVRCPQCGKKGARMIDGKARECLGCMVKNLKAGKYDNALKAKAPRPPGYYWVRQRDGWLAALWDSAWDAWWIPGSDEPHADNNFDEIGPRVPPYAP